MAHWSGRVVLLTVTMASLTAQTAVAAAQEPAGRGPSPTTTETTVDAATTTSGPSTPAPEGTVSAVEDPIEGRYLVTLDPDADVAVAETADALAGVVGGEVLFTYEHALDGFAVGGVTEAQAKTIAADTRVALVEQDGLMVADGGAPRTEVVQEGATWGLDRIDQRDRPLNGEYEYLATGEGVTAYIIDTGIRFTHQDFGGRASNGVDLVGDGRGGDDCAGHGTHVAGTVGGERWGVAKAVRLKAVRVLNCSGSAPTSRVIAGIDWVTGNATRPAVANMSLGGGASSTLNAAVTASVASGVVYSLSAGNSNANACNYSPASTPNAITVGSTTSSDSRSSFSNFGTCVDLFAPGSSITSAWNSSNTATNTISGTSMAAPHVAGVVALHLDQHPSDTPAEVATALTDGATPDKVGSPGTGSPNLLLFSGYVVDAPAIAIVVDARPDATQDFSFSGCGPSGCGSFQLDDDADPTLPRSIAFGSVVPGTYTIEVDPVPGWTLTDLTCDADHSADPGTGEVSVTVAEGARVTCTFTEASAALTVVKDAAPDDPQDFVFTRCGPDGPSEPCTQLTLDDDADPTLPDRLTVSALEAGTWTVTEAGADGWLLTDLTCDGDHDADIEAGRVTVDIGPTEHVTCTFTNAEAAITIVADTDPADGEDFDFTGCGPLGCADFALDDDDDPTLSDRFTVAGIAPATYTITQQAHDGWGLTDLTCDTGEVVDLDAREVSVTLAPGQRTTCTFANSQTIATVVTDADPAIGHDFAYTGCGPQGCGSFTLDDDGGTDPASPDRFIAAGIPPGTYTVTQQVDDQWHLVDLTCDPEGETDLAGREATLTIEAGEQITCTFTNTSTAITIVQSSPPASGRDFSFTGCGPLGCGSFSLDDDDDGTLPSSTTVVALAPGQYTITQDEVPGWRLHRLWCDTDEATDLAAREVTVTLEAGEHTTCTFTDVDPTKVTTIPYSTGTRAPYDVAVGADGDVWVTFPDNDRVGRLDPNTGVLDVFRTTGVDSPRGVAADPTGRMWVAGWQNDQLGRIDPDTGATTSFDAGGVRWPWGIGLGPDGNIWVAGRLSDSVGRVDPDTGSVTNFPATGINDPLDISVGPDDNVWTVGYLNNSAGRIDPVTGSVTAYTARVSDPHASAAGPDGRLWTTGYLSDSIGRINAATGAGRSFSLTGKVDGPDALVLGPDGELWLSGHHNEVVGRINTATGAVTTWPATGVAGPWHMAADEDSMWIVGIDAPYVVAEVIPPSSP